MYTIGGRFNWHRHIASLSWSGRLFADLTFGHSPCQGDGPNAPVSDAWKLSALDVHMQLPRYDSLIQN